MNERTLDERIATMVERVVRDEREIGVLSTGEQIAVAVVLDRRDLLPAPYGDWASAAERLGDEWRVACGRVSAARAPSTKESAPPLYEGVHVTSLTDIDWIAPHRLEALSQLCGEVDAPWSLVPSSRTTTGTVILHDRHGVSIADLMTEGAPCPCDKLIAIAPAAIKQLIAELRRVRERLSLVSRREAELHYAIRRDANILDHKMTEDEAHQNALKRAERMHADLDMLHCTAGSGPRG